MHEAVVNVPALLPVEELGAGLGVYVLAMKAAETADVFFIAFSVVVAKSNGLRLKRRPRKIPGAAFWAMGAHGLPACASLVPNSIARNQHSPGAV